MITLLSLFMSSIVLVLVISLLVYWFVPSQTTINFRKIATEEFQIPGLDIKFCPQGMTKLDGSDNYIISGYMSDNSPSRFYVVDGNQNQVIKYFTLNFEDKYYPLENDTGNCFLHNRKSPDHSRRAFL